MPSFVTHLESAIDGTHLPADRPQTVHKDRPLWVRYDLEAVGRELTKEQLASRPPTHVALPRAAAAGRRSGDRLAGRGR